MTPDPYRSGLSAGWRVIDAAELPGTVEAEYDVVIIGSGAGGGMAAKLLTEAGLHVAIIEEGQLATSVDFDMNEANAYSTIYQQAAAQKTRDMGITILQGRTVGGSTTVNWTSSFRTPTETLTYWRDHLDMREFSPIELKPWFEQVESYLDIRPWQADPNANNAVLERGCKKLGLSVGRVKRNVRGCWNLGYCGMGCPTNAKRSMLTTTIPAALAAGATLYTRLRAQRFIERKGTVEVLRAVAMHGSDGRIPKPGHTVLFRAKHFIVAAGAIGSPALLLRSQFPDPYSQLGKRTFLHPVCLSAAVMPNKIEAWQGAPQTVYSDHFLHRDEIDGPIGYKLEVPPVHPLLAAVTLQGHGEGHAKLMQQYPHLHVMIALLRDGFHPDSKGGQVFLNADGSAVLDYVMTDALWDGVRRAWLSMAEIQFAAGAKSVLPIHEEADPYTSWQAAQQAIADLPLATLQAKLVSAHVMGGCAMSAREEKGVVNSYGRHWQVDNLSVIDGSIFPTSVGTNPQLSIYALAVRNTTRLARELTGKTVSLIPDSP